MTLYISVSISVERYHVRRPGPTKLRENQSDILCGSFLQEVCFTNKKYWYYLLLVPRYSISLIWGHLCLQPENGISLKMKENQSVNPVAERYSPSSGRTEKPLLSASPWAAVSFSGCLPGKKTKTKANQNTSGAAATGEASQRSFARVCSWMQGRGGRRVDLHSPLRSPESGSHLVPAAPQSGSRDLPRQWPRPGREPGGQAAGAAGRIFPPRRRRRRGSYHGDHGGRPSLGGGRPLSAQRRSVCRHRPSALQGRPKGSPTDPKISKEWTGKGGV